VQRGELLRDGLDIEQHGDNHNKCEIVAIKSTGRTELNQPLQNTSWIIVPATSRANQMCRGTNTLHPNDATLLTTGTTSRSINISVTNGGHPDNAYVFFLWVVSRN
jgi:hypothetical protein